MNNRNRVATRSRCQGVGLIALPSHHYRCKHEPCPRAHGPTSLLPRWPKLVQRHANLTRKVSTTRRQSSIPALNAKLLVRVHFSPGWRQSTHQGDIRQHLRRQGASFPSLQRLRPPMGRSHTRMRRHLQYLCVHLFGDQIINSLYSYRAQGSSSQI